MLQQIYRLTFIAQYENTQDNDVGGLTAIF